MENPEEIRSELEDIKEKIRSIKIMILSLEHKIEKIEKQLAREESQRKIQQYKKLVAPPISELAEKLLEHVDGEELLIGVRPEDFRVSLQPLPEGFIGEIYVLEPLGKDIIINVKLDRGNVIKVITSKIGLEELDTGKRIWLKPVENRIHFFNKKTGEAII